MISPRRLGALAAVALIVRTACAQSALYVEHHNAYSLVVAVEGGWPLVREDEKVVRSTGHKLALQKAEEFAPYFVWVNDLHTTSSYFQYLESGDRINNKFEMRADFESAFSLQSVFLLLELNTENFGKSYFVWNVGALEPWRSKPVEVSIPLTKGLGRFSYKLHVFANGGEILHSLMLSKEREQALDHMVQRRIKDVSDAGPKPLFCPLPRYPEKLKGAKISGEAVVGS